MNDSANDFMSAVQSTLKETENIIQTENGANALKTSGKALLDLHFKVSSLRRVDDETIVNLFNAAYEEDAKLALKWLFYARDVRQGLGERRLFRVILRSLAEKIERIHLMLPMVAELGRFDDLLSLLDTPAEKQVITFIRDQFTLDLKNLAVQKPTSLLAKWLPSANASSKKSRETALKLIKALGLTERKYRKLLSSLRAYIDVVERKMSANSWGEINYSAVPSKAGLTYRNAFSKHDKERYGEFIKKVTSGEAKINAGTLFPHDVIHAYKHNGISCWSEVEVDPAIEAMWNNLPNTISEGKNILVVRDGSGSMQSSVGGGSKVSALECSTAMAIYFGERMKGAFKDKFITFSAAPKMVDFSKKLTLADKLNFIYKFDDYTNTNVHAVFQLILRAAKDKNLTQEDMPEAILMLSDMEFDSGCEHWGQTLFQSISKEFAQAGYKLPRLIFWNVCSRTMNLPMDRNELGLTLVSGFSPNVAKMVLSGEIDPYKNLCEVLNVQRYSFVDSILP